MRKLIGLLILLLPTVVFSQKMVNGFSVEAFLGKTYTSTENIAFFYNGERFQSSMTGESDVFGGTAYIPFDMGIKRHRFILALGFEYRTAKANIETGNKQVNSNGIIREGLALKSTSYTPLAQALYRPHFYLGKMHMSFTIGANFKFAVKSFEICDKDNETLIQYDKNIAPNEDGYIDLTGNTAAEHMRDLKFHVDPRIGFDFYLGNSFMISIFGIVPDISTALATKSIKLEYGAGVTYLIRTKKITEAKILQQYKK
ncbi:MAG: hypothetical protein J6T63_01110 [Bacteroidales bacterium]|nr:hypothetical protein [Bacteroidales bacterium]